MAISFLRSGWNRISALSLFVENILLGIEEVRENLTPLVLEHTRRLAKVGLCTMQFPGLLFLNIRNALDNCKSNALPLILICCIYVLTKILEKSSDLKSQEAFEEVITLLRSCKDGAVERIFR